MLKPTHSDASRHYPNASTHKDVVLAELALRNWQKQKSTDLHTAMSKPLGMQALAKIVHEFLMSQYIKFDFGKINSSETLLLQGNLLCIAPLAKVHKVAVVVKHNKEWAIKNKLCTEKNTVLADIINCSIRSFRLANNDQLKLYSDYVTLIWMLNDIIDSNWGKIGAIKDLQKMLKIFFAHLKGLNQKDYIKADKITLPKFKFLCNAFFDIGSRLREQAIDLKYFFNSVELYFNSLIKEFTVRFNHATLSLEEQLTIRAYTSGLDTACELAYALQNIYIASSIRENGYFKQLQQHAYVAAIIAHDILTLGNQLKKKQVGNNYLLLKHELTKNSLQAIFNEAQYHFNTEVSRFANKTQSLLNSVLTTDYNSTLTALVTLADHVQARVDWALQTARYQERMAKVKLVTKV